MARRCCCGDVIYDPACSGGCGFWPPGDYCADFVTSFVITSGTQTVEATKNGTTMRTADASTFDIPTTNGIYRIQYDDSGFITKWIISGPGITGEAFIEVNSTCAISGTFNEYSGKFSVTLNFQGERCPSCCHDQQVGIGSTPYPCRFSNRSIYDVEIVVNDGRNPPGYRVYSQVAPTDYVPGNPCRWFVRIAYTDQYGNPPIIPDPPDPSTTWLIVAYYNYDTGTFFLEQKLSPNQGSSPYQELTTPHNPSGPCEGGYRVDPDRTNTLYAHGLDCEEEFPPPCEDPESMGSRKLKRRRKPRQRQRTTMAQDLQKAIPEAFTRGGCACQDVLGLLSNYSIERAAKKIDTLTKLLFKATQLPGRPDHIAKLTMQDCHQLLAKVIANAQAAPR
ncbi:hypothetical protein [Roseiconus lacunae]|uniref:hypothetical protein n=1 Tax=Roseiconus lacunae TaxID=2605694 RepID=UPI0011F21C7C|nr:hypothetical protein [Roseiconus lacunae]